METIYLKKINQEKRIIFDKPGRYKVVFKNLSGKIIFDIVESNVEVNIYGLYIGKKEDKYEINTVQNHQSPNSTSNLLIKGVFFDSSRFYFQGLIRIDKNAQKSHAYQKNQNLIMSENVYVESQPNLEILANDVFCTHGSTTGYLNQEELFYTISRGLKKERAEKLLVEGFINDLKLKAGFSNL